MHGKTSRAPSPPRPAHEPSEPPPRPSRLVICPTPAVGAGRARSARGDPRLRSAQRAGQLDPGADLDLVLDVLYAPLFQRWLHRSAPLTAAYADSLVDTTLRAFAP
ncbi:TetR-like C-terminal domain-containing protein [Streptomyces laurentii]|uniref:TetR-like C-terminal domain-containing protein n=1 Tax=Streptomyces laurentii TaxID=39478 RepID=UPI0036A3EE86